MRDVLVLLVEFFASLLLSVWVVRRDMRRLGPRELARAWPDPSLWAAVVWFSPLCVLVHFTRTRRSLVGLLLGLVWLGLTLAAIAGLSWAVDGLLSL